MFIFDVIILGIFCVVAAIMVMTVMMCIGSFVFGSIALGLSCLLLVVAAIYEIIRQLIIAIWNSIVHTYKTITKKKKIDKIKLTKGD